MEEGDGGRRPVLISSGMIIDEVNWVVPAIRYHGDDGEVLGHAECLSFCRVALSIGQPVHDPNRVVFDAPEDGLHWPREDIRFVALHAAILRAHSTVDQFLYFFLVEDREIPDVEQIGGNTQRNPDFDPPVLAISSGYPEPPDFPLGEQPRCRSGTPDYVARQFARHIYASASRTWEPTPERLRIVRPPPRLGVTADAVPSVCGECSGQSWFRPCCAVVFCRRCSAAARPHLDGCPGPARSVPVPPIFTTEDGERVPSVFVELEHPTWQQCRFVTGVRYSVSSYYNTEDAYFFDAERGIRFQVHLYRREGPGGWMYRVDLVFRSRPTGPINIRWNQYVAQHYATLWPGIVD